MPSITLTGVTKRFDRAIAAVDDLSLDIADGEFLVLLGPSGCGKTTALRLIAGLEHPDDGSIAIGDRVVDDLDAKDRDVAMVFQSYALYPHLSVRDNIAFPLKPRGMSRAARHREAERVAELLDLTELLHRKPRQLSGGQQQRVALARALVRRPSVFLMDEPLSNLDARLRTETRADLVRLQRRLETTTIYVTHDQVEALTMADRIAVLDSGQLQQLGTPDEIYDTPANVVVAGFVGDPPMNLWAAEITPSGSVMVEGVEIANAACVPRQLGTSVVVGVRPEAVELADTGLPATVDWVDDLGHEHLIGCTTRRGGAPCCMRWRGHGRPPVLGSPVHAYIDPARIHWFDTRSGRRIPCG